ncbi:hypothetical protein K461DRAFT_278758 [Myriangium duriaei CBS 260.36]|uniref:Rhodopsin domain-containing protein n=1 Tax=Myriangium duriaei CBS 260.36 TaxID=1168546 RepID=A0A9P4IZN2_9PEZI|nr:hypothetical protein K461DRAFT_278758 [Myriangium duriaei CBS 260.36]
MIWVVAVTLSRFAILLFYFRIFVPSVMRVQRIITFALIGILLATALAEIISAFLECRPFRYIWDKTIVGGTCVNINALYRYASLPGVITDLVMLLLPLSIVRQLQASLKVKIGLATTFLFGSL